jgi:flagellar basal-body rod protein FlgB
MINKLIDPVMPGLEKMMDLTWRRNEAISSNIANAETPLYRATDLNFAGELAKAFGDQNQEMQLTNTKHMDIEGNTSAHLVADTTGMTKQDGNNVDIDIQMGKLASNGSKYTLAANIIRKKYQFIYNAIRSAQG